MEEVIYNNIIKLFKSKFKSREYIVDVDSYDAYFTKSGERDKRKKYFRLGIGLKSLRKFDTLENTRILGDAFTKCSEVMGAIEENHPEITFNECTYNGGGILELKFCSVTEVALRELTATSRPFSVEKW